MGDPVLGDPAISGAKCGLELLDPDFLGVPGGEGTGVGPFPLALLSPKAFTKSLTDTPCNSGGIPGSRLDDFGDPDTGDLVSDIGDLERNDVSNFEKEAEAGVEKEDSDPNEGCDVVCVRSEE